MAREELNGTTIYLSKIQLFPPRLDFRTWWNFSNLQNLFKVIEENNVGIVCRFFTSFNFEGSMQLSLYNAA
jgi:hypothetical protein